MYWLFGVVIGVVVLVLLVLTIINFKRYAWQIILLVVVLVAALGFFYWHNSDEVNRTEDFALDKIKLSQAELTPSHGSYYQFAVDVDNLSDNEQLAAIEVLIELLDCADGATGDDCVVTESSAKHIKLRLLATDSKRVEAYIPFSEMAVERDAQQWRYNLVRGISR